MSSGHRDLFVGRSLCISRYRSLAHFVLLLKHYQLKYSQILNKRNTGDTMVIQTGGDL